MPFLVSFVQFFLSPSDRGLVRNRLRNIQLFRQGSAENDVLFTWIQSVGEFSKVCLKIALRATLIYYSTLWKILRLTESR